MAGRPYGKQQRDRARRETKAVVDAELEAERWCPPSQFDCEPSNGTITIPLSATARILQRLEYEAKRLVYYSISLQCRTRSEEWEDAARIDCSHCLVHIHTPGAPNIVPIMNITRPEDVWNSYDASYAQILDNWEEYERQWNHGR